MAEYRTAVRSGRSLIAPCMEMEKQFSNTEHMIIMYGGTGSPKHEWQTVSFFEGKYNLTMSMTVTLSADGARIISTDEEPVFLLTVCEKIIATGGAILDGSREQKFELKKWQAFKASGFDLTVLDPAYDGSTLPGFDEYANDWQKNRRVWR